MPTKRSSLSDLAHEGKPSKGAARDPKMMVLVAVLVAIVAGVWVWAASFMGWIGNTQRGNANAPAPTSYMTDAERKEAERNTPIIADPNNPKQVPGTTIDGRPVVAPEEVSGS
ncbi:MAG: hypothetical protein AB7Q00_08560 [Phycisphaerales bacterium]|nr:MAG: hypothetical protein IPK69_02735 [Phycisphaerales bacterium]